MNGDKEPIKLPPGSRTHALDKYQMLRYEVVQPSIFVLMSGTAEICGTELVCGNELHLYPGQRGTIVTFHGCKISHSPGLNTFPTSASEDREIPHVYMNLHASLEDMRQKASLDQSRGPRVLICGQEGVGKSTLCRILASYAARRKRKPILVDVNVGSNHICLPTTIAAVAITKPYDLSEGWDLEEDPMVFCFGHANLGENLDLFKEQVARLADLVNIRTENDTELLTSGCIINMAGFNRDSDSQADPGQDNNTQAIHATATAFEVNAILVIEDGFMANHLKDQMPPEVSVLRLPKSSGVVGRSPDQHMRQRDARVRAYFHGQNPLRQLHPFQVTLNIDEYSVFKINTEQIPDSLLPHGSSNDDSTDQDKWSSPCQVEIDQGLRNTLLGISQATDPSQLATSPVYGFLVVVDVSGGGEQQGESAPTKMTVLSPCSHQPPNNLLLLTSICYVDPEQA